MPNCYRCGEEISILIRSSICSAPSCSNRVTIGESGSDNFYCPYHQKEFPKKIEKLEKELERLNSNQRGLQNPSQEVQELRTENQALTTDLSLKSIELAELQGQIRALEVQLNESENNQPLQSKLELVKNKLKELVQLITNRHG